MISHNFLEDEDFYADAEDGSGDGHRGQLIMNNLTNQLNGNLKI